MMAWKVPTGVLAGLALIFAGIGCLLMLEGAGEGLSPFLLLLLAPVLGVPDPSSFEPEGTSAMWLWVAWPIGGMLCGIVTLLWEAFARDGERP